MKRIIRNLSSVLIILGVTAACTDLNDINQKIDSLESRVTALEKVIPALNDNVEGLQTLVSGGTINGATEKDGVWTITLSNGETITLTQGSIGVGNAPVMSVDKDGYWMVNYGDGAEYIMNGENKVKAIGTDGTTPKFGVDADGYWTVSYDGGSTFQQVKGADGNPVSALPSGEVQDPYFSDVKLENGELTITLREGDVVKVPVISNFLCAIEAEGLQIFAAGETKPYNVTMKGVKSTMITVPAGWKAVLSEPVNEKATLTVTAPSGSSTKSTIADSQSDISILAFSEQNFATIAKIQVQSSDAPITITPVANITAGTATETTLTYNVATADVTAWKYLCIKEGEEAPDAAKLAAEGTAGEGTSVTVEGLESATAYVLYVLPVNGEIQGSVASCKNTTLKKLVTSYYALYNAGETITINGNSYSKDVNGEATLMEANGDISTNGVYFIKEGVTATYTGTGAIENLIVIGDKEGVRSTFKGLASGYMKLNSKGSDNGKLIFHNVVIDYSSGDNYFFTVNYNEKFADILFDDCEFKFHASKPIAYISSASRSIKNLTFSNCDLNVTLLAQPLVSTSSSTASYGTFTIKNCVFYSNSNITNFKMHGGNAASYDNIVFTNNTLVNIVTNGAYFNCGTIKQATMTGNIFFMNKTISANHSVLLSKNATITGGTIQDNISYTGQTNNFMAIYGGSENWFEGVKEITILDSDPFSGGTFDLTGGKFVPSSAYASYGAKR